MLPLSRNPDGVSISPSLKEPITNRSSKVFGTTALPIPTSRFASPQRSGSAAATAGDARGAPLHDELETPELDVKWLEEVVQTISVFLQHDGSMTATFRNVSDALGQRGVIVPVADRVLISPDLEYVGPLKRFLKCEFELGSEDEDEDVEDEEESLISSSESESDEEESTGSWSEASEEEEDDAGDFHRNEKRLYAQEVDLDGFCERAREAPLALSSLTLPSSQPAWLSLVARHYRRLAEESRTSSEITNPGLLLLAMGAFARGTTLLRNRREEQAAASRDGGRKRSRPESDALASPNKRVVYQTP